jgi:hypothetical protein
MAVGNARILIKPRYTVKNAAPINNKISTSGTSTSKNETEVKTMFSHLMDNGIKPSFIRSSRPWEKEGLELTNRVNKMISLRYNLLYFLCFMIFILIHYPSIINS